MKRLQKRDPSCYTQELRGTYFATPLDGLQYVNANHGQMYKFKDRGTPKPIALDNTNHNITDFDNHHTYYCVCKYGRNDKGDKEFVCMAGFTISSIPRIATMTVIGDTDTTQHSKHVWIIHNFYNTHPNDDQHKYTPRTYVRRPEAVKHAAESMTPTTNVLHVCESVMLQLGYLYDFTNLKCYMYHVKTTVTDIKNDLANAITNLEKRRLLNQCKYDVLFTQQHFDRLSITNLDNLVIFSQMPVFLAADATIKKLREIGAVIQLYAFKDNEGKARILFGDVSANDRAYNYATAFSKIVESGFPPNYVVADHGKQILKGYKLAFANTQTKFRDCMYHQLELVKLRLRVFSKQQQYIILRFFIHVKRQAEEADFEEEFLNLLMYCECCLLVVSVRKEMKKLHLPESEMFLSDEELCNSFLESAISDDNDYVAQLLNRQLTSHDRAGTFVLLKTGCRVTAKPSTFLQWNDQVYCCKSECIVKLQNECKVYCCDLYVVTVCACDVELVSCCAATDMFGNTLKLEEGMKMKMRSLQRVCIRTPVKGKLERGTFGELLDSIGCETGGDIEKGTEVCVQEAVDVDITAKLCSTLQHEVIVSTDTTNLRLAAKTKIKLATAPSSLNIVMLLVHTVICIPTCSKVKLNGEVCEVLKTCVAVLASDVGCRECDQVFCLEADCELHCVKMMVQNAEGDQVTVSGNATLCEGCVVSLPDWECEDSACFVIDNYQSDECVDAVVKQIIPGFIVLLKEGTALQCRDATVFLTSRCFVKLSLCSIMQYRVLYSVKPKFKIYTSCSAKVCSNCIASNNDGSILLGSGIEVGVLAGTRFQLRPIASETVRGMKTENASSTMDIPSMIVQDKDQVGKCVVAGVGLETMIEMPNDFHNITEDLQFATVLKTLLQCLLFVRKYHITSRNSIANVKIVLPSNVSKAVYDRIAALVKAAHGSALFAYMDKLYRKKERWADFALTEICIADSNQVCESANHCYKASTDVKGTLNGFVDFLFSCKVSGPMEKPVKSAGEFKFLNETHSNLFVKTVNEMYKSLPKTTGECVLKNEILPLESEERSFWVKKPSKMMNLTNVTAEFFIVTEGLINDGKLVFRFTVQVERLVRVNGQLIPLLKCTCSMMKRRGHFCIHILNVIHTQFGYLHAFQDMIRLHIHAYWGRFNMSEAEQKEVRDKLSKSHTVEDVKNALKELESECIKATSDNDVNTVYAIVKDAIMRTTDYMTSKRPTMKLLHQNANNGIAQNPKSVMYGLTTFGQRNQDEGEI